MNRASISSSLSLAVLAVTSLSSAHNPFEIDVAAGYRVPGSIKTVQEDADGVEMGEGRLRAEGAFVISGTAGYRIQPDGFIYLTYSRAQTTFTYEAEGTEGSDFSGDGSIEYFQFGGNIEATRGVFVPYLGASVGFGRIASFGGNGSRIFFATALDGGMKFDVHEHVHLRLVGRLPIIFTSRDVFCTGAECASADQVKPLAQIEALGGIGVSF